MPKMSLAAAARRTEQIRRAWKSLAVLFGDQEIYSTVSAGIGVFPQDGQTRDTLLQVADQALYVAKADGRNCIRHGPQKQLADHLWLN
jgi:diguanylate cyclase (GGDEF)-like protein